LRDPLIAPLAATAGGILLSRFVSFEIREIMAAGAAFILLALIARRSSLRGLAFACVVLAFIAAGAVLETLHRPGVPPTLDATFNETVLLTGCVVSPPVFYEGRGQFVLELEPQARARVNLYSRESEIPPMLCYGQKIELEARVRRPHNFGNPGGFDYVGYLARQNIYWNASARGAASVRILDGTCGSGFWSTIFALREKALARIEQLYRGNTWASGMMQAILIGESSQLEKIWTEHFRRTGTYHALVISGLHITVLAGFLLFLLRILAVPATPSLVATTMAAWLYTFVAGWQAPVVRAAGGFTLYLVARFFYRRTRVLNLLAAVALAYLFLDPEQLFEASFQLSFLSVAAIGALAVPLMETISGPYARGLRGLSNPGWDPDLPPPVAAFRVELRLLAQTGMLWTRLPERFWLLMFAGFLRPLFYMFELAVVSAVVQIGLALPMIVYFHRASFTGVLANAVVVPLLGGVVPIGFIAVFGNWAWAAKLAGWLLTIAEAVARWCASIEPNWRVPDPPLGLALAFVAALLALPFLLTRSRLARWTALAATLALFAVLLWHPFAPAVNHGALELTAIDVGEGDSLLLATPRGKLVLMDAGGIVRYSSHHRPRLDIGEDVVSPYLWSRSIRRLDAVAFSHPDEDHIGGMASVIRNFRPSELWVGVGHDSDWNSLREEALRQGTRIVRLGAGQRFEFGGAQVEVVSASNPIRANDSLVARFSYGRHSFLLTGDAERDLENDLLARGVLAATSVLKVAHHGSKTSTLDPLLDAVRPTFAVISVGYENSFGHPHPHVLRRLVTRRIATLRTDQQGLVSISTDGVRFHVRTNRESFSEAGWLRLDPFFR
jgi:competence protein ComEC